VLKLFALPVFGVGLTGSSKEGLAGFIPPARPLRSMQTGQNSIAPESSLPQLGQVRLSSVFMGLPALQPQSEPKSNTTLTEWCEIVQRHPLANDGPASIASLCIQPRLSDSSAY